MTSPFIKTARQIAHDISAEPIISIERFLTGKANYVYDVKTAHDEYVIRLSRPEQKNSFKGMIYWHQQLSPLGIPLPAVRFHDTDGKKYGYPLIVMERLAGRDLIHIYPNLTNRQKEAVAMQIVTIQKKVSTLCQNTRYGYATSYTDPSLHSTWQGVLDHYMTRIVMRNNQTNLIDKKYIDILRKLFNVFEEYIAQVKPTPFLDDITTKNVIVNDGVLSGIVDVEYVCFGDPLFTLALTQASLIAAQFDTFYTDYWVHLLNLTPKQKKATDMYRALFILEFASSMGHTFNKAQPEAVDLKKLSFLLSTFTAMSKQLL